MSRKGDGDMVHYRIGGLALLDALCHNRSLEVHSAHGRKGKGGSHA
jgi:hypothetical protein